MTLADPKFISLTTIQVGKKIKDRKESFWIRELQTLHPEGINNQRLSRACIVHLVIKRTNWSYVKTMSCSGSHLGITINIKNTKFVKDLPMIMHSLGSISAIASEMNIFLYFPHMVLC
jgi:hypothetical protein